MSGHITELATVADDEAVTHQGESVRMHARLEAQLVHRSRGYLAFHRDALRRALGREPARPVERGGS